MLKKKLKLTTYDDDVHSENEVAAILKQKPTQDGITSKHFIEPFWKQFYNIECSLNTEIKFLKLDSNVRHIYNPVEYAREVHCHYLKKYLNGPKDVMLVGMNPGANGMAQTGVPFGNIKTVKDWMKLEGEIEQPENQHPKRPIKGLQCTTEEPSGNRIWSLVLELSGDIETFSERCFIHNFCPLVFYSKDAKNLTPSEIKGESKKQIKDVCMKYLEQEIELVNPKIIIPIGSYVADCLKNYQKSHPDKLILTLAHPSPRSLNNTNWPEKAKKFFREHNLLEYFKRN